MFVKWKEMSSISGEHSEVKSKGANEQDKIPGKAEGNEIDQWWSRRMPFSLELEDKSGKRVKMLRITQEEKVLSSFTTVK